MNQEDNNRFMFSIKRKEGEFELVISGVQAHVVSLSIAGLIIMIGVALMAAVEAF